MTRSNLPATLLVALLLPALSASVAALQQSPAAPSPSHAGTEAAPPPPATTLEEKAAAAYKAHDWEHAADLLTKVTAAKPDDAQAWHDLGYCLHSLSRYEEALAADQRAVDAADDGTRVKSFSTYNVACALAMLGRKDEALDWLARSIAAGFRNDGMIDYDPELVSLRGEARYAEILGALRATKKKVAIVVYQGVEMLDFAGPAEVFADASTGDGFSPYRVMLVAPTHEPVHVSIGSGTVVPEYSIADCPAPDIVVVPGGETRVLEQDPAMMAWLRGAAAHAEVMMSVCNGAFVYGQLGLLDGLPATTHHSMTAGLRRKFPAVDVREGVRFVDNGKVLTTAGISAGIDGALGVVARQFGAEAAKGTARGMDYVWQPD